jgi:hypothetical protein
MRVFVCLTFWAAVPIVADAYAPTTAAETGPAQSRRPKPAAQLDPFPVEGNATAAASEPWYLEAPRL